MHSVGVATSTTVTSLPNGAVSENVKGTAYFQFGGDFMAVWKDGKELKDITHLQAGAKDMLDQLSWWTRALKVARNQERLATVAGAQTSGRQARIFGDFL